MLMLNTELTTTKVQVNSTPGNTKNFIPPVTLASPPPPPPLRQPPPFEEDLTLHNSDWPEGKDWTPAFGRNEKAFYVYGKLFWWSKTDDEGKCKLRLTQYKWGGQLSVAKRIEDLAWEVGLSREQTKYALKTLREAGIIE